VRGRATVDLRVPPISDYVGRFGVLGKRALVTDIANQARSDETKSVPVKNADPAASIGEQVEIADLVLYLASPASDFICGQVVVIDGGYSAV
jgi:NAD(P)-dependent dehydrogenase (short-subunit alcohol dehydrogenase family)